MALPKIDFIRGQGGLGRQLAGEDHISGMQFNIANGEELIYNPDYMDFTTDIIGD